MIFDEIQVDEIYRLVKNCEYGGPRFGRAGQLVRVNRINSPYEIIGYLLAPDPDQTAIPEICYSPHDLESL